MSYEKTTWAKGDLITSEKLNHLEDGVGEAFIAPPIGGTDVGKVLGVTQDAEENPVYGLVEPSGGTFWVNFTQDGNQNVSADKTAAEILTALASGLCVFGRDDEGSVYNVNAYSEDSLAFCWVTVDSRPGLTAVLIYWDFLENVWIMRSKS